MNKQTKIIIAFFFALFVGLGSVFYFVSKKIDPQSLRKNIVAEIEKALPGSKAAIDEIDFSIGIRTKIYLKKVLIKDASQNDLLIVQKTEVEVPVFDILKGGGRLEVRVEDPVITLPDSKTTTSVLGEKLGASSKTNNSKENKEALSVPSFVKSSRWDLKVDNLKILASGGREYLVKKAIFKNLNLEKTTAFEIISDVLYSFSDERTLSSQAQAVGEINIAELLEGKLNINMLVNSEKASLSWTESEVPPLKSVIKLVGSNETNYDLSLRASGANSIDLETELTFSKGCCEKISINKLESSVSLKSLFNFLSSDLQKQLENFQLGDSKLSLNGTVLYEKDEVFRPSLEFSVDAPISFKKSIANHAISFDGHYVGDNLSVKFTDNVLDGVVTLDASTTFTPFSKFKSKVEGKLLLTSLKISKDMAQGLIYKKTEKSAQEGDPTKKDEHKTPLNGPYSFIPFDFLVEGKHIYLNDQEMNISGKFKSSTNKIVVENFRATFGAGELRLKAIYESGPQLKSKITLQEADMRALNSLLPPFVSNLTGTFSGNIEGAFQLNGNNDYVIKGQLSGENGSLEGLDLASVFSPVLQKIPEIQRFDAEALREAKNFKSLKVKGKFTEKTSEVNEFELKSSSGKIALEARGNVFNSVEKESAVKAVISGRFIETKPSYKELKELYFLLTGKGVRIQPRLQYTLDMMKQKGKIAQ